MAQIASQRVDTVWRHVSGAELDTLYQGGESLTAALPTVSAVYMWKLRLADESLVTCDPSATLRKIIKLAKIPQGRSQPIRASHGLVNLGIEICGSGLPSFKQKVLSKFLAEKQNNRWMINYLRDLEKHLPTLYVGETGNLPQRAKEHLAGLTDFGQAITREPQLGWSDLNFYYANLGPESSTESQLRKAVEYVTAVLTVSAYTQRPG